MADRTLPPAYRIPLLRLAVFAAGLLIGRRRSFARDGAIVMKANRRFARRVEGAGHVPPSGAFLVVMNHYSRRGLRPYHIAMAVSDVAARVRPGEPEVRWAFTSEYRGRHIGPVPIPLWFIRWVFRRVAVVYGFVVIPRREKLMMGRAASLRELLRATGRAPIGMTPEGLESTGRLVVPPEGNGLLLAMLTRRGIPVLPIGAWEDGNVLCIRVGEPFDLHVLSDRPRDEQDRLARDAVMMAIGRLLPRPYWGAYQATLAAEASARGSA